MKKSPKILIIFYSMYGHTYQMAKAVAEGVKAAGGIPILKQVAELMPEQFWNEKVKKIKKTMEKIPIADARKDLQNIDGIIVGTPTRYGNMCAQMRNFWDQTGGEWVKGVLIGKPGGVFTSTGTQHGGQETTIITTQITLMHQGCVIVGLPYSFKEQTITSEITGGSPYGPSTIAGSEGQRMPSKNEKKLAKHFGSHLTKIAKKLA